MRGSIRGSKSARLHCEALEDRLTPAVAYALSGTNLLAFDTAAPSVTTSIPLGTANLVAGESLVGMDFRPQNGQLYALGINASTGVESGTLYTISVRTGQLTRVGAGSGVAFTTAMGGAVDLPDPATTGYGLDFNPAVDRLRVVAGSLNFRINPNTGGPIDGDAVAAGTNPDGAINGLTTTVDAVAYTNNSPNNGNLTTQYTLDSVTDRLFIQNPPNNGTQVSPTMGGMMGLQITLGGTPLDFTAVNGFDIGQGVNTTTSGAPVAMGTGFANLTVGGVSRLYTIDLTTGVSTLVGAIGSGAPTQGLAVASTAAGFPAVALNAAGTAILRFNTATPGTVATAPLPAPGAMGGVATGETLVAMDYRPNTGQLFALAVNTTANTLRLYLVTPQTVTAGVDTASVTAVGTGPITNALFPMGTMFPASGYGFDFNPTAAGGAGLIRVTTETGLNFRIQPNDGTVAGVDTPINGGGSSGVSATAYTNSFGQPAGGLTSQYTIDSIGGLLFIQTPPNSGTQTASKPITLSGAPLVFTDVSGFDIPGGVEVVAPAASGTVAAGFGYAVLTVGTTPSLYRIDLATGAATLVGGLAGGGAGLSLGDATGGVVTLDNPSITVNEGGTAAVTINRTGGTGPLVVTLSVGTGSTATAGADFAAGPFRVVIPEGATSATLNLPITADMLTEGAETLVLTLSTTGGVVGAVSSATVTVNDTSLTPPPAAPPPPFFSGATQVGNNLVLQGAGVAGGTQVVPLPPGSNVIFADLSGDGKNDVVIITPSLAVVVDGATGRFLALATDVTGDGVRDLLIFNPNGTTTTTNGRTGVVTTM